MHDVSSGIMRCSNCTIFIPIASSFPNSAIQYLFIQIFINAENLSLSNNYLLLHFILMAFINS